MKSLDLGEAELRAFGHPMYQAGDFEIKYYLDKDFTKGPIAVDIMGKLIIAGVQIEAIDDYNKSKKPLEEKYGVKFPIDYGMDNFPFQLTPLYTMPSENIKFTHGKLLALDIKEEIAETVAFGRSVYVNLKDL
ncbi:MAG: hypothetical protein Fur0010_22320 [Bdellovibrio sp.]